MLKVKDWPPQQEFRERMVRHNQVSQLLRLLRLVWKLESLVTVGSWLRCWLDMRFVSWLHDAW